MPPAASGTVSARPSAAVKPMARTQAATCGGCASSQSSSAPSSTTCSGMAGVSGAANVRLISADLLQRVMPASLAPIAPPATAKSRRSEGGVLRLPYLAERALTDPQEPRKGGSQRVVIARVDAPRHVPRHPRQQRHADLIGDRDKAAAALAHLTKPPLAVEPLGMTQPRR